MDVTPRELRDIDIREGFRGYNRDDVDELLERAATTIDGSNERIRRLTEQLAEVESKQGKSREAEDMLQRTLLLAQRAADEAVAEAQIKARQILDDAETRARNSLAEAESTARRQAESERARLEGEVLDLGARREALLADVAQLEKFEAEYRVRLRRALEADLESLAGQAASAAAPRPPIHEVDLPKPSSTPPSAPQAAAPPRVAPAPAPTPPSAPAPSPAAAPTPSPIAAVPNPAPVAASAPSASANPGPPTAELSSVGEWNAPPRSANLPPADVPPLPPISSPPVAAPTARGPLFDEEPAEPEALDDDAFFASLREAVTDETPLGPRDDQSSAEMYDGDESGRGGLFRRRSR